MSAPLYLNHAGCSKVSPGTLDTIMRHHELEAEVGVYEADRQIAADKQTFYARAASLIGAKPEDIAYIDSHTTGWERALRRIRLAPGDVLLTSRSEWGGNLKALRALAHAQGGRVEVMPADATGAVCVKQLSEQLHAGVKLISLTWLGSNGGALEPATEVGKLAQSMGIPFFLDASQVVGQLPVDVQTLDCDVLTTPGRKWLRGPRGSGFLYARSSFLRQTAGGLCVEAQDQCARQLEPASCSVPLMLGLSCALQQMHENGLARTSEDIGETARCLWEGLRALPQISCLHAHPPQHGLVSFTVQGLSAEDVKGRLQACGIEVSANQAAFTPLDMHARGLDSVVRVSAHAHTSPAEIAHFLDSVAQLSKINSRFVRPAAPCGNDAEFTGIARLI